MSAGMEELAVAELTGALDAEHGRWDERWIDSGSLLHAYSTGWNRVRHAKGECETCRIVGPERCLGARRLAR